jgi:hypothetical protein
MRIVTGVGDLVQRTEDGRTGRVILCAVYTVHVETRAQISWLRLKNKVNGLSVV